MLSGNLRNMKYEIWIWKEALSRFPSLGVVWEATWATRSRWGSFCGPHAGWMSAAERKCWGRGFVSSSGHLGPDRCSPARSPARPPGERRNAWGCSSSGRKITWDCSPAQLTPAQAQPRAAFDLWGFYTATRELCDIITSMFLVKAADCAATQTNTGIL